MQPLQLHGFFDSKEAVHESWNKEILPGAVARGGRARGRFETRARPCSVRALVFSFPRVRRTVVVADRERGWRRFGATDADAGTPEFFTDTLALHECRLDRGGCA